MKFRLFVFFLVVFYVVTYSYANIALSQDFNPPVINFEEPFNTNPSILMEGEFDFTASVDSIVGVKEIIISIDDVIAASKTNSNKITYKWKGKYGRYALRVFTVDYRGMIASKDTEVIIRPVKPAENNNLYALKTMVLNMQYMGYNNSAEFLKNSLDLGTDLNYDENSMLSQKIGASKAYNIFINQKINDAQNNLLGRFEANDTIKFDDSEEDFDLWLSLHGVKINTKGELSSGVWKIQTTITDRYDFHYLDSTDFVSQVNNLAYKAQQDGELKPFDITVRIADTR